VATAHTGNPDRRTIARPSFMLIDIDIK
jgi:hypothetical protein